MARRINLVPQTERARTTTNFAMLGFVAAVMIVLAALGLGYYSFSGTLSDRKDDLTRVQQDLQALQSQVAALAAYGQIDAERANIERVVTGAYAGRTLVSKVLDDLGLVVPENVWFDSIDVTTLDPGIPPVATDTGEFTVSGNTYGFQDIAQLLVRLQLIPALGDIKLESAGIPTGNVDTTTGVKGFSIHATVTNTQPEDTVLPMSQVEVEGL